MAVRELDGFGVVLYSDGRFGVGDRVRSIYEGLDD
jgi:hypothetical protein